MTLQGTRTSLARAGACGIAAITVDAEAARAVRRHGARGAIDALTISETVAIAGVTFIAGIGVGRNVRTRADAPRIGARNARSETSGVATNAVDTVTAHALRRRRTRRTIALLALPTTVASTGIALIERIAVRCNW